MTEASDYSVSFGLPTLTVDVFFQIDPPRQIVMGYRVPLTMTAVQFTVHRSPEGDRIRRPGLATGWWEKEDGELVGAGGRHTMPVKHIPEDLRELALMEAGARFDTFLADL